ncbi:hypothetical protein [Clostridium tagluense]|uniref:hypothetical protein n=1 Tax=Clostridium tagluense TaxID=360422 RepID=UPI001CF1E219|nr:hypothetical protein [Clostridium tagluense]MCB2299869.1 hypothetical protein [Clostridium tagluense]
MEDSLVHLQYKLNKALLNTYIGLDEYNYNLLFNSILDMINSVAQGANLSVETLIHEFSESYIIIKCKNDVLATNESLAIYIEFKNNIIVNAEVSILL